jgi:hypothetical protein
MIRKFTAAVAVAALTLSAGVVGAQSYTLSVAAPASAGENSDFSAQVILDFDGPDNMAGWSYGVCNDVANITLNNSEDGSTTSTVNNGNPPGFAQGNDFPDGYTKGVVVDLLGAASLAPGAGYELSIGNYTAGLETPGSTITFCDTLGTPPVATVVVINGASIVPTQNGASVEVVGVPDPAYTYNAPDLQVNYSATDGNASFTIDLTIDQDDNGAPEALTQGFSMGLSHDPSLVSVTSVDTAGLLAAMAGGSGPGFIQIGLGDPNGWTAGVVYDLLGGINEALQDALVFTASYETVAGALVGVDPGPVMTLAWDNGLGTPPVANVVVVGGASLDANFSNGSITFNAVSTVDFRRADSNQDGMVNIADGIWILNFLFQGGPMFDCEIASDANDDDLVDMSDASYIFMYRFMGGAPPPAPWPSCGTDVDQQPAPEDCNEYNAC